MNMSEVPMLFTSRRLPLNVALIQVSPVDDFGWMSLGISVDGHSGRSKISRFRHSSG